MSNRFVRRGRVLTTALVTSTGGPAHGADIAIAVSAGLAAPAAASVLVLRDRA
ncbi:hypothetical protein ACF07B_00810 [Streptomyces sp. NPDC015532]|uniref:hypothetical protein n=1 Tax=Streptomyces sp. NPDC015532 TaxID=3364960 RepID=UPI0036F70B6B